MIEKYGLNGINGETKSCIKFSNRELTKELKSFLKKNLSSLKNLECSLSKSKIKFTCDKVEAEELEQKLNIKIRKTIYVKNFNSLIEEKRDIVKIFNHILDIKSIDMFVFDDDLYFIL